MSSTRQKKILAIAAVFILGAMPVIAGRCHAEEEPETTYPGSIIQALGDIIKGKYEVEVKPFKKIGAFQYLSDELDKKD